MCGEGICNGKFVFSARSTQSEYPTPGGEVEFYDMWKKIRAQSRCVGRGSCYVLAEDR